MVPQTQCLNNLGNNPLSGDRPQDSALVKVPRWPDSATVAHICGLARDANGTPDTLNYRCRRVKSHFCHLLVKSRGARLTSFQMGTIMERHHQLARGSSKDPLHMAGARGDRICSVFPGPPRPPARRLSLGPEVARARRRTPGGDPLLVSASRRAHSGTSGSRSPSGAPRPGPRSRPLLPSSGGLTMAATQLRGPGGLTSWPRGPCSRAAGGSKVKGVCEERTRRACALLQRAGRGRKPVCGRGFGRGMRPPPALGNLRRLRTPYTPPVTTLGCCEQRITPVLPGAGSYFFPSFCQNIWDLKTWNNHTFHKRDKE